MRRPDALCSIWTVSCTWEDTPIPGAVEAVAELRALGLAMCFVTNTTSRPRAAIVDRLGRLAFDARDEEVVTPARLAVRRCREQGRERVSLLMADAVKADLAGLEETDSGVEAVIVGDPGHGFTCEVLNRAFRHLMEGAELLALQKNRLWLTPDGLSLDVGPFVAALEYATRREAFLVGKPSAGFFAAVLDASAWRPAEAAMVGDDVESNVDGAQLASLAGILVRTGEYRADVARRSGVHPAVTIDSIADLPNLLCRGG